MNETISTLPAALEDPVSIFLHLAHGMTNSKIPLDGINAESLNTNEFLTHIATSFIKTIYGIDDKLWETIMIEVQATMERIDKEEQKV